jgi:predicted dehydrogenase
MAYKFKVFLKLKCNSNITNMKRRTFFTTLGATIGTSMPAFSIVSRHVLGGKNFIAPSDKLNVAAIGAGGKAWQNLNRTYQKGEANIVSLCDVDDRMAKQSREAWPEASYYKDFRQMLDKEDKNIDGVIVSSPDHMHAVHALRAMKMGKHVYVEKPLTHDIQEARTLTEAAGKYKVVTQMGNQGSSGDDTRYVEKWIQDGVIGEVERVHVWTNRPVWPQGIPTPKDSHTIPTEVDWDLWLGTAPERPFNPIYIPANWRGWVDFGTGALGDMGCHFIDVPFRALKLGYPTSVQCSIGSVWEGFFEEAIYTDSYPPSSKIHIQFPQRDTMPPVELIWYDGGILPRRPDELKPDEPMADWDGGIIFEGSKGKLMAGLFGERATLLPTSRMKDIKLPEPDQPLVADGAEGHQQQWVEACKKGFGSYTSSNFDIAGPLTETVIMGNLAVLSYNYQEGEEFPGRKLLLWDGPNMKITNFEKANDFVKRTYRGTWDFTI